MSEAGPIQRRMLVAGRVQGVGFRAAAAKAACTRGDLRGWVRNLADGRVEAVVFGPRMAVLAFADWCRRGPPSARVERLEILEEIPDPALPPFAVRL